jgi:hypothetical protein
MLQVFLNIAVFGMLPQAAIKVVARPGWTWKAGGICTVTINRESGVLAAGADPRRMGYALGW